MGKKRYLAPSSLHDIGAQMRRFAVWFAALATLSVTLGGAWYAANTGKPGRGQAEQVSAQHSGSVTCTTCHASQHQDWQQSDHARAMEHATANTVLGNFDNTTFTYFGRKSFFSKQDDRFWVKTENQQGQQETFSVRYTLGFYPLQQYLVEFPDGSLQALPFAWDTRDKKEGGQRWFHLYPNENITPDNPLFWTRPLQNWNHMCADCHVTGFEKNFSAASNTFQSHWRELANGCESCHGPGSAHIEQMTKRPGENKHFKILSLRSQEEQINQCGVCHSRRDRLQENPVHEKILETWRPELLHEVLYFHDGQIHDEVFEIGSFLQSKMYGAGVTCTSCHDPHTQKLKADGNALCTQCHSAPTYDNPQHHFHSPDTTGARCTSCHMPSRTYMGVDVRHDHRFSIPRPDLSDTLGTPNPCISCHATKSNTWAAQHIDKAVRTHKGNHVLPDHFGLAFWQARREQQAATESLSQVIRDPAMRVLVRATALAELPSAMGERSFALLQEHLQDADPLVRLGAASALAALPESQRNALIISRLDENTRAVRFALAPMLAAVPENGLTTAQQERRRTVLEEYEGWLTDNSDRAEALVSRAALRQQQGSTLEAQRFFEAALQRDPLSLAAHLNYADFYRSIGNDTEAEKLLLSALKTYPDSADAHYALGLLKVRAKATGEALALLSKAMALAPNNSQYIYVYAVGLYSSGKQHDALSLLARARQRFPANPHILAAVNAYCTEPDAPQGHPACAP